MERSRTKVLHRHWFFILLGWFLLPVGVFLVLFGFAVFGLVGMPVGSVEGDSFIAGIAIGPGAVAVSVGIWFAGTITSISPSNEPDYVVITRGWWPIFLPPVRRMRISREEAGAAFVSEEQNYVVPTETNVLREPRVDITYAVKIPRTMRQGSQASSTTIDYLGKSQRVAEVMARHVREFARE